MDLKKVSKVYFLGIGGIGMSALARYFHYHGSRIYGYDLTPTPLTGQLEKEGMQIHYLPDINLIPEGIDLVIYTPAIPDNHPELCHFKKTGIELFKRSEIVGQLSENQFTIAIAGTHGKTSISAIAAHMLYSAGKKVTALVGGIMKEYDSNIIISKVPDYFIIEADEYDRSFLKLKPDIAVISSMDADHLDIYGNTDRLSEGFRLFTEKIKDDGSLIVNDNVQNLNRKSLKYGFKKQSDIKATNVHISKGKFIFNIEFLTDTIEKIKLTVPGHHFIENALAAASIGFKVGLNEEQIKNGLETFKGVERRFEVRVNTGDKVFIDDYAHHPEEIRATVKAIKLLYPEKKLTGVFQPHLFTRTRDFAEGFANVLEDIDEILLLPIYPAREEPIQGITSAIIYEKIKNPNKQLVLKNELTKVLQDRQPDVLVTMGAGDIGLMTTEIEQILIGR